MSLVFIIRISQFFCYDVPNGWSRHPLRDAYVQCYCYFAMLGVKVK
jgi:hypothetical protein